MSESSFAEFITYYKRLPQDKGTCRIYERNDGYSIYGEDAMLINQEVLKASKLKVARAGDEKLSYVNINKANFVLALKYLLFVRQYKIEILKNIGTVRSPHWTVCYKASPGNLTAIEDLILGENASYVQESRGLMAVKVTSMGTELMVGAAFCDPVLREIQICEFTDNSELTNLQSVFVQLSPQECLVASSSSKQNSHRHVLDKILKTHGIALTECKTEDFSTVDIVQDLNRLINLDEGIDFKSAMKDEADMKYALSAVAAIIKYLELLADENNFDHYSLSIFKSDLYAKVDIQSVSGLGLFPENPKDFLEKHYLLGHLNNCGTNLGERLLVQWIKQPLMDLRKLEERLDIVEIFVSDFVLRNETSKIISKFPDIETVCRKIQRKKANLQDLYKLYVMIKQLPELLKTLSKYDGELADVLKSNFIAAFEEKIDDFSNYASLIESTIDFDALKNKEFVVKAEYDAELLEIRQKMNSIQKKILSTIDDTKDDLNAPTVKLECCKVIGYHYRLTRKEEKSLRHRKGYIIIDTKSSGVRFQSIPLKSLNEQYISYKKSYEEKQKEIVDEIVEVANSFTQPLKNLSHTIAWLDVSLSFAAVSVNAPKPYIRPKLREKGDCCINLKQARHPVLESKIENFIPNDVEISKDKHLFYFVTGPNMGGKSTYIRSVALNVLLAQIGCFVPCDEAEISITDAFLTRIGACDKPSKAVSTFMFEMVEIQNIIKSATSASLLIIDEMGRGTSTYDGFGLSWAISSHIAEKTRAPCLFATHFHELTELSKLVPSISNLHVEAITSDNDIIFLYHVKPGVCDESFGIHVAKLAGFPDVVIKEAREKLHELNKAHMPIHEILAKFKDVPGGEIIINALEKKLSTPDADPSLIGTSGSQSVLEFMEEKTNSQLERLAKALDELVEENCL